MNRKFALAVSVMAALLMVAMLVVALAVTSAQAAPLDTDRVAASTAVASKIVVNELYRSGSFSAAGDEWVELLLINDLTAAELGGFYFGDSTASVAAKYSGYHFTNTSAIASTFRKGTLIVIGGGGAVTDSISYDPASGDWNIVLAATGAYLSGNGLLGDFAATDVAYVDTNGTNGNAALSADGFAVKWGTTPGAFGNVANLTVTVPGNGTGLVFTSTLAEITIPTNWASSVVSTSLTRGQPNGGDNTTYIESLRSALAPQADLGVSKDGQATALASETITYTISLSNTGTYTATGTVITDTLPAEVTFITYTPSLPGSFTQNGQNLVWDLGDVPTTGNVTLEVRVGVSSTLLNGASFTNTVTASTTYTEPNQANNTDNVTTFIGAPDLVIVKTGPDDVNAGETFTYTLVYSNAGAINATNVAIVDRLPAGISYTVDSAGGVFSGNTITWTIGGLNAGVAKSILLTATARYAGDWPNGAAISGGPIDSNPANNTSMVTTTVNGADPFVRKSGPAIAFGGELISYTLTYGNSGNVTATATLTDQLPIGFTLADIAVDNSGLPFVNGAWTADIAPDAEVSFTFALTVPATMASSTRITNSLAVSAIESGDDPSDNAASASSTVYQIVPIATARAATDGQVFAVEGQVIVLPGTYSANEWELQDATGAIVMFYSPAPSVALGDRIRVVAPRNSYNAQQELDLPVYFQKLGGGTPVAPKPFSTGSIAAGTAQGWLVVVSGTLSNVVTCAGNYDLFVNNGSGAADVFINSFSAGAINPCAQGFANGEWAEVTGFSTIFSSTTKLAYEVRPRSIGDFVRFPRVVSTNPISGAVAVPVAATITATFNMSMTNVGTSTLVVAGPSGAVAGAVAYDAATKTATFTPAAALAGSTLYTATLKATLTADNGRSFMPAQDVVWTFTTRPLAPNLSGSTKANAINGAVRSGERVTYTIRLINTGDAQAAAIVTDVLPSYYTVAQLLDFTQPATGTLTWTGVVTAGQSVTLRFVAQVAGVKDLPLGQSILDNSAQVNDGMHQYQLNDQQPPQITIYGVYLPLIRR